jgi:hypothetical protein
LELPGKTFGIVPDEDDTGSEQHHLELPGKTFGIVPDEDDTGSELDQVEIALRDPVQPPGNPTELGQQRVAANPTDARLPRFPAFGRFLPEARVGRPFLAGAVAIRPVRPGTRQVPRVGRDYL